VTIHFICRGNTHRSLIAEAYLKSLQLKDVTVFSSGSVADFYRKLNEPRLLKVIARLSKHGIGQFAKTRADQLTQERADSADVTVCMNQIVVDECNQLFTLPPNTIVWDIVDTGEGHRIIKPGEDQSKYTEEIYQEITQKVDELVQSLHL